MTYVPEAAVVQQDLSGLFFVPPTFEDFRKSISTRSGKTAGGLSDLTYSMMKAWPLPFKTLVYNNLTALWALRYQIGENGGGSALYPRRRTRTLPKDTGQ